MSARTGDCTSSSHFPSTERYLKCGSYKDKLADFASSFDGHKLVLRDLLQGQTALKVIDIQTDVKKVLEHIVSKTAKEQETEEFVKEHGGLEAVLKVLQSIAHVDGIRSDRRTCSLCIERRCAERARERAVGEA